MFDLKRLEVAIEIGATELQALIQNASQAIINQAIKKDYPLLGGVEIEVLRLDTPFVKISQNLLKFTHLVALKIDPSSPLIPKIQGEIRLESDLLLAKAKECEVNYKITQALWINGPTTEKGKSLGLVRKLTSVLLKNTDIIETLVEDRIRESLTPTGLRSVLQKVPKQFTYSGLNFQLNFLHIQSWDLLVEEPHLMIKTVLNAQIDFNSTVATEILVESKGYQVPDNSELFLSDSLLTEGLSLQLDKLNSQLDSLHLEFKSIKIEIIRGNLLLWLQPVQLRKPIRLSLALHFERETNCIFLDRCDLDSSSKSGFIIKGAIKLFGGKIEEIIAKYFPIYLSPLLNKAMTALSEAPLPYKIGIEHSEIIDLRLLENKTWISFKGRLALSSTNKLSQEEE